MRKAIIGVMSLFVLLVGMSGAQAQKTLKIGVILPFTGQFAHPGTRLDNGIKLYMRQNGNVVAGRKIEIIRKDVGGIAPDVAKRLAQELIVRDKVDMLAGFLLTPNALATGAISQKAKKFMVIINAATAARQQWVADLGLDPASAEDPVDALVDSGRLMSSR